MQGRRASQRTRRRAHPSQVLDALSAARSIRGILAGPGAHKLALNGISLRCVPLFHSLMLFAYGLEHIADKDMWIELWKGLAVWWEARLNSSATLFG